MLNAQAAPTPRAISENMLRRRFTTDCQPRTKSGHPPHSTTGVASSSSSHCSGRGATRRRTSSGARSAAIASTNAGTARTRLSQKRRLMSISSGLASSSAVTLRGSSAIPQIGQLPGAWRTISGCIGHQYSVPAAGG